MLDESTMTGMSRRTVVSRMALIRSRPPLSGIWKSLSTRSKGFCMATESSRLRRASSTPAHSWAFMCQARSCSRYIWRLVALSSTIRTRFPRTWSMDVFMLPTLAISRTGRVISNEKRLPLPGVLSNASDASISSSSRRTMGRPRPVPLKRRVVEASTCSKALKTRSCFSRGMPMPVSLTATRMRTSWLIRSAHCTHRATSPCGVNLRALLSRFMSICRRRLLSPRR